MRKSPRRKRIRVNSLVCLLLAGASWISAQGVAKQDAKNSICSNVITGHGNVTLKCSGLTPEQAKQLNLILNTILQQKLDTTLVLQKLQDIQRGVSSIQSEIEATKRKAGLSEQLRQTAPQVDAYLAPLGNGKVRLYMRSINLIPYTFIERIVTTNNIIVTAIAMTMQPVYPTPGNDLIYSDEDLHMDQIKDEYLELRWTYQSLTFDELHLPGHSGKITRRYRIENNGASLTEIAQ